MIISLNDCIMSLENMQRSERKASIKSIIKPQGSKFRTERVEEFSKVRLEELSGQLPQAVEYLLKIYFKIMSFFLTFI